MQITMNNIKTIICGTAIAAAALLQATPALATGSHETSCKVKKGKAKVFVKADDRGVNIDGDLVIDLYDRWGDRVLQHRVPADVDVDADEKVKVYKLQVTDGIRSCDAGWQDAIVTVERPSRSVVVVTPPSRQVIVRKQPKVVVYEDPEPIVVVKRPAPRRSPIVIHEPDPGPRVIIKRSPPQRRYEPRRRHHQKRVHVRKHGPLREPSLHIEAHWPIF